LYFIYGGQKNPRIMIIPEKSGILHEFTILTNTVIN